MHNGVRLLKKKWLLEAMPINAKLLGLVVRYCNRYPETTHENCNKLNTHFFIDLRDEYLERHNIPGRMEFIKALWRAFLFKYEGDDAYARPLDWLLLRVHEAILSRKIKLHPPDEYNIHWRYD